MYNSPIQESLQGERVAESINHCYKEREMKMRMIPTIRMEDVVRHDESEIVPADNLQYRNGECRCLLCGAKMSYENYESIEKPESGYYGIQAYLNHASGCENDNEELSK